MIRDGKITASDAATAFAEDIAPPAHMFMPENHVVAPAFVRYVTGLLVNKYGSDVTYTGGLRVITTLNPKLQELGQTDVTSYINSIRYRNVTQGALVALDPTTGAIVAMVGSANPGGYGGQYNLAVWPPRNPGSSMKIFTYTAAIESGRSTMTTPITDSPVRITDPGSQTVYSPQNYDGLYHGTCQLQVCLGSSLNIPAVKVELGVGVPDVVQMARIMGAPPWQQQANGSFTNNNDLKSFGPSLTLGGYGETPLQMATGASVLAAQGVLHQPFAITHIEQGQKTIYQHADSAKKVLDPKVAYIMSTMMSKDSNRYLIFGANSLLTMPGYKVAVKTGTSDSFADAWTVGFTPQIAVAVWMGNPDWRVKMTEGSDSYYVAVPAWHSFLSEALPLVGHETWYSPPAGLVFAWDNYYLPGTAPFTPPEAQSSPAPSSGGHHRKKKH